MTAIRDSVCVNKRNARARLVVPGAHARNEPPRDNVYVKLQWKLPVGKRLTVYLHLAFVLEPSVSPEQLWTVVTQTARPRSPADVPLWIGRIGAARADWRLEVETRHGSYRYHPACM